MIRKNWFSLVFVVASMSISFLGLHYSGADEDDEATVETDIGKYCIIRDSASSCASQLGLRLVVRIFTVIAAPKTTLHGELCEREPCAQSATIRKKTARLP